MEETFRHSTQSTLKSSRHWCQKFASYTSGSSTLHARTMTHILFSKRAPGRNATWGPKATAALCLNSLLFACRQTALSPLSHVLWPHESSGCRERSSHSAPLSVRVLPNTAEKRHRDFSCSRTIPGLVTHTPTTNQLTPKVIDTLEQGIQFSLLQAPKQVPISSIKLLSSSLSSGPQSDANFTDIFGLLFTLQMSTDEKLQLNCIYCSWDPFAKQTDYPSNECLQSNANEFPSLTRYFFFLFQY